MTKRMSYDSPKLTRDEATELCVYHLRCAAGLFQLVPDDNNVSLLAEIDRQTKDDVLDTDRVPAKLWAASMLAHYEAMKEDD